MPSRSPALALASLPFIVERRFGILGTGLNPDMSQHLFAVDRLAAGGSERLIADGYPLGPHAIVVAISALGPSTVQAFDGLTLAVAVAACLAPLALLGELSAWRRIAGALCVGFAYLVAAYLVQGAFKETMQALFVLAFAIGLGQLARGWTRREGAAPRPLRALPLAVLAIGSVYAYSFPGLLWLAGAAAVWAAIELARAWRRSGFAEARLLARLAAPTALAALRLAGAGDRARDRPDRRLRRLRDLRPGGRGARQPVQPALAARGARDLALGRLPGRARRRGDPGDRLLPRRRGRRGGAGLRPALVACAAATARVPAALVAAALLWLYSLLAGTPYQEAKALVLIAPLVMRDLGPGAARLGAAGDRRDRLPRRRRRLQPCSRSPTARSGRAATRRSCRSCSKGKGGGSVQVEVPDELLDDQHGLD